jgi:hypothetical protein
VQASDRWAAESKGLGAGTRLAVAMQVFATLPHLDETEPEAPFLRCRWMRWDDG